MLISNISVDDSYQLFETPIKQLQCRCTKCPDLLGDDDAQFFETPRINKHSVTLPSSQVLFGG